MPLNPRGPVTQVEIETEIIRLTALLEEETLAYAGLIEDAARKEAKQKVAWARAYLSAEGAIKERESRADFATGAEHLDRVLSEGSAKAKRELLASIRTNIDALRTLNANTRYQVQ